MQQQQMSRQGFFKTEDFRQHAEWRVNQFKQAGQTTCMTT